MLKEKWREYRRQKKLQQLESVASEYIRIKKPTNVLQHHSNHPVAH